MKKIQPEQHSKLMIYVIFGLLYMENVEEHIRQSSSIHSIFLHWLVCLLLRAILFHFSLNWFYYVLTFRNIHRLSIRITQNIYSNFKFLVYLFISNKRLNVFSVFSLTFRFAVWFQTYYSHDPHHKNSSPIWLPSLVQT